MKRKRTGQILIDGVTCPVARTAMLVADGWTVQILRDLFLHGPRRFQDFADSLPGISPNLLSSRIKKLLGAGIIRSELYSEHPPRNHYLLTEIGRDLGPLILQFREFGEKHTRAS